MQLSELDAIRSARAQYAAAFLSMACGGRWHIYRGVVGPVLTDDVPNDAAVLVRDIQGMSAEAMVNALSAAIKRGV